LPQMKKLIALVSVKGKTKGEVVKEMVDAWEKFKKESKIKIKK
jgi:hypothetical protein